MKHKITKNLFLKIKKEVNKYKKDNYISECDRNYKSYKVNIYANEVFEVGGFDCWSTALYCLSISEFCRGMTYDYFLEYSI